MERPWYEIQLWLVGGDFSKDLLRVGPPFPCQLPRPIPILLTGVVAWESHLYRGPWNFPKKTCLSIVHMQFQLSSLSHLTEDLFSALNVVDGHQNRGSRPTYILNHGDVLPSLRFSWNLTTFFWTPWAIETCWLISKWKKTKTQGTP